MVDITAFEDAIEKLTIINGIAEAKIKDGYCVVEIVQGVKNVVTAIKEYIAEQDEDNSVKLMVILCRNDNDKGLQIWCRCNKFPREITRLPIKIKGVVANIRVCGAIVKIKPTYEDITSYVCEAPVVTYSMENTDILPNYLQVDWDIITKWTNRNYGENYGVYE